MHVPPPSARPSPTKLAGRSRRSFLENMPSTKEIVVAAKKEWKTPNSVAPSKGALASFKEEVHPMKTFQRFKQQWLSKKKSWKEHFGQLMYIPMYRSEWHREGKPPVPRMHNRGTAHEVELLAKKRFFRLLNIIELNPEGFAHDHQNCNRVKFNVSGKIFETQLRTLRRYPETLLGNENRLKPFYDPNIGAYYFDRNRVSFEAILYYYQSGGRLRRPLDTPLETFYGDIVFYDLGDEVLNIFILDEGLNFETEENVPSALLKRKIWLLFEYPESSTHATCVSLISIFTIVVSVTSFCVETLPNLRDGEDDFQLRDVFFTLETCCVIWFILEYVFRLLSCPHLGHFLTDLMNFVDVCSVLPYFLQVSSRDVNSSVKSFGAGTTYLTVLRVIRLVRVFRIFKLSRHSKALQILGLTLKASMRELFLLIFFLGIGVVLFSSVLYFVENELGQRKDYKSIPDAFYWSIVTMTTVGYGDLVPQSVLGKLVGSLCAVAGVLSIALPVPVVVSNFNYFYHLSTDESRVEDHIVNVNHVLMCPYLPNDGVHPKLLEKLKKGLRVGLRDPKEENRDRKDDKKDQKEVVIDPLAEVINRKVDTKKERMPPKPAVQKPGTQKPGPAPVKKPNM